MIGAGELLEYFGGYELLVRYVGGQAKGLQSQSAQQDAAAFRAKDNPYRRETAFQFQHHIAQGQLGSGTVGQAEPHGLGTLNAQFFQEGGRRLRKS